MDTPRYDHDCTRCIFLGQFRGDDLYYCPSNASIDGHPTIIARHSSEGGDYSSGLSFALHSSSIYFQEAFARAYRAGYRIELTYYVMKHEAEYKGRIESFNELVKLVETPRKELPLLFGTIKHQQSYFEYLLKGGD